MPKDYRTGCHFEQIYDLANRIDEYENTYDVCIPSCHNRKPSLLEELDSFKGAHINVFIYDFEEELYDWLERPDVTKVIVPKEYLTIMKMRVFIQEYMGDKKYWVVDDDFAYFLVGPNKIKINTAQGIRMMEIMLKEYEIEWDFVGANASQIGAKFWDGVVLFGHGASYNCLLYDGKKLREAGLKYQGDPDVSEDIEFLMNSIKCGLQNTECKFLWGCARIGGGNSTTSQRDMILSRAMKMYIKYGEFYRLRYSTNAGIGNITGGINRDYVDFTHYEDELLSICESGDSEKLIEYLEKYRNKKKKKKSAELF